MIKKDPLCLFSCLPLLVLMFSPAASCNSTKKDMGRNVNLPSPHSTPQQRPAVTGTWGATGIVMEVTDSGAEIGYDCAHGRITEKIVLDGQGKFSVRGRHVREHAGPTRDGEAENGQAATYRGSVSGDTMTLTVTIGDSNEVLGTFTLTHGSSGRLRRCA